MVVPPVVVVVPPVVVVDPPELVDDDEWEWPPWLLIITRARTTARPSKIADPMPEL